MIVLAGVVVHDNTILIAKRSITKSNGGLWEFPGGKQETNESDELTLKREFTEEFGMNITVENFLGAFSFVSSTLSIELRVWFVKMVSKPLFMTDHDQIEWVTKESLRRYVFSPADIPAVKMIQEGSWIIEEQSPIIDDLAP